MWCTGVITREADGIYFHPCNQTIKLLRYLNCVESGFFRGFGANMNNTTGTLRSLTRYFHVFIWSGFVLSCSENRNGNVPEAARFSLPRVIQYDNNFKNSLDYFTADYINDASTFFIDKFHFGDTVSIDNVGDRDISFGNDYITGDSAYLRRLRDSLPSDGLQVIPDYEVSVPVNWTTNSRNGIYYPVFVVNETHSDKLFTPRDRYIAAIQEAKDRNGKWHPIESKKFDFVGKGRWALIIHPQEYAVFITSKFKGPFKTLMRIRLRTGGVTYISKAFEGSIDERQFRLKPGSYQYNEYKNDKSNSLVRRFLGSSPAEPE